MLRAILGTFLNIVVPARPGEQIVLSSTPREWLTMQTPDGLPYHDPRVSALVWELKYFGNTYAAEVAAPALAERVLGYISEEIGTPLLIPIPLHHARQRGRGHNQSEILCHALLPHLNGALEYRPNILSRPIDTPHQQGLDRKERLKNVRGSMRATSAAKDRVCIVVDDVTTTGATLREAARALTEAGARRVHTLALAYS